MWFSTRHWIWLWRKIHLEPGAFVEFAKACRDAVLVHVSTAYVNGRQKRVISEDAPVPDQTVAQQMGNGRAPDYSLDSEIEDILAYSREVEAAVAKSRAVCGIYAAARPPGFGASALRRIGGNTSWRLCASAGCGSEWWREA